MRSRLILCAVLLSLASTHTAFAQGVARVLIPVSVTQVPGAFGSLWGTELWYRNNSPHPVAVFPLAVADRVPTIGRTERLPVGEGRPGLFLHLTPEESEDDVQFDLRLFNRSDTRSSWGTKLPVVRDEQFRDASVQLINVPTGEDFRAALRIYGLPEAGANAQTVTVEFYGSDEQLLATSVLPFEREANAPRYAQILAVADELRPHQRGQTVRVAIASSDSEARIWAFVSVTANETQQVVVITEE